MGNGASTTYGPGSRPPLANGDRGSVADSGSTRKHPVDGVARHKQIESGWDSWKIKLQEKESEINALAQMVEDGRQELRLKDAEIEKLKAEIHKLQSVLDVKIHKNGKPNFLATIHEESAIAGQETRNKKQGVSGESSQQNLQASPDLFRHFEKDFRSKRLIKDAVLVNDFLKNLGSTQIREIVDCMYERKVTKNAYIIKEGEAGQHLYVSAEGELTVSKDGVVLGSMGAGCAFGELAILYNCTRTASVQAEDDLSVWVLDRRVFQAIMMKTGLQRQHENMHFLNSVPLFQKLNRQKLAKLADVLEVDFYHEGEFIIREDAAGDTFYIISKGEVQVTQTIQNHNTPKEVRTLKCGSYFGEKALLSEDRRTANVIALQPGVECLTVDRASFKQLIGELNELRDRDYGDLERGVQRPDSRPESSSAEDPQSEYAHVQLADLDNIATLGMGGFGRVELVRWTSDGAKTFALKCLKKQHVVEKQQHIHLFSEKAIMMSATSPFIARLYKTFKDNKYVYMLMEACLGGELWTILRNRGHFDDLTARFYTACVVEALDYLHRHGIVYRDLKPENLMLSCDGYVKLVDFGFSKKIGLGGKTWTFCGTPDYLAPEVIQTQGHDHAADYWSLGVLVFELLTGSPPFAAPDQPTTYRRIIGRGIDGVDFPKTVSRKAHGIIKRLCCQAVAERLGYGSNGITDIRKHMWFQGFDWDGLKSKTLVPPIIPKVRGPADHSNFDTYPNDTAIPPDETSGWDAEF